MNAKLKPRLVIEATIIRKDGTKEELGKIAECKKPNIIQRVIRSVNPNG